MLRYWRIHYGKFKLSFHLFFCNLAITETMYCVSYGLFMKRRPAYYTCLLTSVPTLQRLYCMNQHSKQSSHSGSWVGLVQGL